MINNKTAKLSFDEELKTPTFLGKDITIVIVLLNSFTLSDKTVKLSFDGLVPCDCNST